MDFIDKYKNTGNRYKFQKTLLPIQNILDPQNFKGEIKVFPLTVNLEMQLFENIRTKIDQKIPSQFLMFEDLIPGIVSDIGNNSLTLDNLTLPDINFIIYNMRILTYGTTQKLHLVCSTCKDMYNQYHEESKDVTDQQITDKLFKDLSKKYNYKNPIKQSILTGSNFYTVKYDQDLQKFDMKVPDKLSDIFIEYESQSGNKFKFCPPRLGWYEELKQYLIDFRKVVDEIFIPNKIEFNQDKLEVEATLYNQYSNISLYIYSIDNEIVKKTDIKEIPIVVKNILTKKDVENIQELLRYYDDYILKIKFETKCPNCGRALIGDVTSFFYQYVFGISE